MTRFSRTCACAARRTRSSRAFSSATASSSTAASRRRGYRLHELGIGGAGIVLALDDQVIATKSCGFESIGSFDAEREAVIRAARWIPQRVCMLVDVEHGTLGGEVGHDIIMVPKAQRGPLFDLAHELSANGRNDAEWRWVRHQIDSFDDERDKT